MELIEYLRGMHYNFFTLNIIWSHLVQWMRRHYEYLKYGHKNWPFVNLIILLSSVPHVLFPGQAGDVFFWSQVKWACFSFVEKVKTWFSKSSGKASPSLYAQDGKKNHHPKWNVIQYVMVPHEPFGSNSSGGPGNTGASRYSLALSKSPTALLSPFPPATPSSQGPTPSSQGIWS